MTRTPMKARDVIEDWRRDGAFSAAYAALEDAFSIADALIRARAQARMTQDEVARSMGTTKAVVARLESGRAVPSTGTLQRFAQATGTRLVISFESLAKPAC